VGASPACASNIKTWVHIKQQKNAAMNNVQFELIEGATGSFFLEDGGERVAEMEVGINGQEMTVYHTEVQPEGEGKGLAKMLLAAMVEHARANNLKVIAQCTFVHLQFKKHQEEYKDIWQKQPAA
jgi:predicted GNAT family acetyltransferase